MYIFVNDGIETAKAMGKEMPWGPWDRTIVSQGTGRSA